MRRAALVSLVSLVLACEGPRPASLIVVGDLLLASRPGELLEQGRDPLAAVASELARSDWAVANLECAVAASGEPAPKMYTFRASPSVLPVLHQHFDAVSLANNHSGDFGPAALRETMAGLQSANIGYFGAGMNLAAAHRPWLLNSKGLRVALLGYDEFFPRWFEAGVSTPGVAFSEDEQVVLDIARARAGGAQVVLPFLHWGWENESIPSERQRSLARTLIDAGADAVIGAHPHVTQGVEYYRGKLIVYSLGNFLFDLCDNEEQRLGWGLRLSLDARGLVSWSTLVFRLDDDGLPSPDLNAESPCGSRRLRAIGRCRGGALPAD